MEYTNIFKDSKYENTAYVCGVCNKLSYDYETHEYTPKVIETVETFLIYDKEGEVIRQKLYVCPHCGVPQICI